MADPALMLREASNHLILARTEMHAFDPKLVDAVLAEGMGLTTKVDAAAQAALARGVLPAHGPRRVAGIHRPGGDRAPDEDQNPGVEDVGFRLF